MAITITWSEQAKIQFDLAIKYIETTSPQNASSVAIKIISVIDSLKSQPEKFPIDQYKLNNSGNFRAMTVFNFRISYSYNPKYSEVVIVRFRPEKMNPKNY